MNFPLTIYSGVVPIDGKPHLPRDQGSHTSACNVLTWLRRYSDMLGKRQHGGEKPFIFIQRWHFTDHSKESTYTHIHIYLHILHIYHIYIYTYIHIHIYTYTYVYIYINILYNIICMYIIVCHIYC